MEEGLGSCLQRRWNASVGHSEQVAAPVALQRFPRGAQCAGEFFFGPFLQRFLVHDSENFLAPASHQKVHPGAAQRIAHQGRKIVGVQLENIAQRVEAFLAGDAGGVGVQRSAVEVPDCVAGHGMGDGGGAGFPPGTVHQQERVAARVGNLTVGSEQVMDFAAGRQNGKSSVAGGVHAFLTCRCVEEAAQGWVGRFEAQAVCELGQALVGLGGQLVYRCAGKN